MSIHSSASGSFRWVKGGRIFAPEGNAGWMNSHAQVPTVLVLEDRLRIYFATRPRPGLSLTTFLDADLEDPTRVFAVHDRPILELGPPGAFDEHGIMPSCVFEDTERIWLYYSGWSRRASIPYSNWTGLAWSEDGGRTFRRAFPGPVVDRTPREIFSATGAYVIRERDRWYMWYASGTDWIDVDGRFEEVYRIRHGVSADGIQWTRENRELLPRRRKFEPIHRPSVIRHNGAWHMWFSHRDIEDFRDGANAYRLGYAASADLKSWTRDDTCAGLDVSPEGWDSRMTAYPYVVRVGRRVLLFYCGNGFGAAGFGYAGLEAD